MDSNVPLGKHIPVSRNQYLNLPFPFLICSLVRTIEATATGGELSEITLLPEPWTTTQNQFSAVVPDHHWLLRIPVRPSSLETNATGVPWLNYPDTFSRNFSSAV